MTDEEIIKLWQQGWSIERIANNFPSVKYGERKPSWQMINRVETVIIKYQS